MEKLTREELTKRSKQIFDRRSEVNDLIATEDGQFFLNDGGSMGAVQAHCKENNLQYFTISRAEATATDESQSDAAEKAPVKPLAKMTKAELQAKATELLLEFDPLATNALLIAAIEAVEAKS